MIVRQYIVLFTSLCCIYACEPPSNVPSGPDPAIIITNSSGDDFSYLLNEELHHFAPYPFNVGTLVIAMDTLEVMLISKRLNKGQRVGIQPLAKMTLSNAADAEVDIIIATPIEEDLKIIRSSSFYEFTVEQFSYKQMVEYWYSNRYGLQGTSVKGWSPTTIEDLNVR